jgi:molybdopterin-synthase adenylyltransferase
MRESVAAMTDQLHDELCGFLLRPDGQEDVCFAIYRPLEGAARWTALLIEMVKPEESDREVHGNASFGSLFVRRAIERARQLQGGIALLHSHPLGRGWQPMSRDDIAAESGHAAVVLAATGFPLVGLTVARDRNWSARVWWREPDYSFRRNDCQLVRVAGRRTSVTLHPETERTATKAQTRTVSFWGDAAHARITGIRIGIVGLGSVGSVVAETLVRMGCWRLVYLDHDIVKEHNLDRTLGANVTDVGTRKVDVAARQAKLGATAASLEVTPVASRLTNATIPLELLDCDVIFSCVDRPLPRHVLNRLSYSAAVPVIDGGILVRFRPGQGTFLGANWAVHTVGPGRPCLLCRGAYDLESVSLEETGLLDDPRYIEGLPDDSPLKRRENIFPLSAAVAAFEVLQLVAMVSNLMDLADLQQQRYSYYPGVVRIETLEACGPDCPFPALATRTDDSQ